LESIAKDAWRHRVNLGHQAELFVLDPERNKGPLISPGRKWHKGNAASGRLIWWQDTICMHNVEPNSSLAFVYYKFQITLFFFDMEFTNMWDMWICKNLIFKVNSIVYWKSRRSYISMYLYQPSCILKMHTCVYPIEWLCSKGLLNIKAFVLLISW
jgi:hypothetical protein